MWHKKSYETLYKSYDLSTHLMKDLSIIGYYFKF